MDSRDINKLHPALAKRFKYLRDNWDYNDNQLILASTYRSKQKQAELWDLYQNHNGPKAAPPGQSLHNYIPTLAFDVAFITKDNTADYSWSQFAELGRRGEELGLEWGGKWGDGPHFQFPMTWQQAAANQEPPTLPPIPTNDNLKKILNSLSFQLRNMLRDLMMRGS